MDQKDGEDQKWEDGEADMVLELADGTGFEGVGFGAKGKSAGGECVFQTGEFFFFHLFYTFPRTRRTENEEGKGRKRSEPVASSQADHLTFLPSFSSF